MVAIAFGHYLETLHDGLTVFRDGKPAPMPLGDTDISVQISEGLATLRTTRTFKNHESGPIEAIMTMPVGFDAVVTGLVVRVDGRVLKAKAAPKEDARIAYEDALDSGKMAVLHEEILRGVHMLSVGQLGPGREVSVEIEAVVAMSQGSFGPYLRMPFTVGQLYGASPLAPADDLSTSASVKHRARLQVRKDCGQAFLGDGSELNPEKAVEVLLNSAIEIEVKGGVWGSVLGTAADGKQVHLDLRPAATHDKALEFAVLCDRSGSTRSLATSGGKLTIWEAMQRGLRHAFEKLGNADHVALWQFDDSCELVGIGIGSKAKSLIRLLEQPRGGISLGPAIGEVIKSGATDILVITDGQTWSNEVDALSKTKARISAILVGSESLDANIGQLCAMTGGQIFYAPGEDVATPLLAAFKSLRLPSGHASEKVVSGTPVSLSAMRGGISLSANWSEPLELVGSTSIGRYAAALALPLLTAEEAEDWARAHSLCTHRTSLILVDDTGEMIGGLSQTRKIPLMAGPSYGTLIRPMPRAAGMPSREAMARLQSAVSPLRINTNLPQPLPKQQGLLASLMNRFSGSPPLLSLPKSSVAAFMGFDWIVQSERLLSGDFHSLTEDQREVIDLRASLDTVRSLSNSHALNGRLVALGLIAAEADDRASLRFARKVFANVPESEWKPLVEKKDQTKLTAFFQRKDRQK